MHPLDLTLHIGALWGALPEKWGTGMCGLEDPFSHSPCRLQEPHFSIFSVLKVLLSPQNHNLKKNFSSKASKLAKSSVPKPQKLGQTSVHKARAIASLTVPGGQEYHFPHFFHKIWIKFSYFSSNFSHFLPHFGPPGGQVAHLGRPWLRHCTRLHFVKKFSSQVSQIRQ